MLGGVVLYNISLTACVEEIQAFSFTPTAAEYEDSLTTRCSPATLTYGTTRRHLSFVAQVRNLLNCNVAVIP